MLTCCNNHIKFISYDGEHPCLCAGTLVLDINGIRHTFGSEGEFPKFWSSGGTCCLNSKWKVNTTYGDWIINIDKIPEQFRQYAGEIDKIFNDNVEQGCCGGCI